MIHYYASDVTKLSDEELKTLAEEIVSTGILEGDDDGEWEAVDEYGPETWQFQAHERWGEIIKEQHGVGLSAIQKRPKSAGSLIGLRRRWDLLSSQPWPTN